MKLKQGMKIDDFTFNTGFESGISLKEFASKTEGKTALIFLRYYGCTLCQYDIHMIANGYDEVLKAGGQLAVVLQSTPEMIASQMKKEDLPFDIICDPNQELYAKYEILPAKSKLKMADLKTVSKISQAKSAGFTHGEYEGNELQLPAIFVIDRELTITHAHYAKTVSDMPEIKEIANLVK